MPCELQDNIAGGNAACNGDEGGPLVVYDKNEPKILGQASWIDKDCRSTSPGEY